MTDSSYSQFLERKNGTGAAGKLFRHFHCNTDFTNREDGGDIDINLSENGKCDQKYESSLTEEGSKEYSKNIDLGGHNVPIYRASDSENVRIKDWITIKGDEQHAPPLKHDIPLGPISNSLDNNNDQNHINDNKRYNLKMDMNQAEFNQSQMALSAGFDYSQGHQITDPPYSQHVESQLTDRKFTNTASQSRLLNFQSRLGDFVESQEETRKLDTHYTLLCPFCGTAYLNLYFWRKHVNEVHEFGNYQNLNMEFLGETHAKCRECNAVLKKNFSALQLHRITHLPFSRYVKCHFCRKGSAQINNHFSHLKNKHRIYEPKEKWAPSSTFMLLCPFCGIEFTNSSDWREHLNVVHEFHNYENLNMESLGGNQSKCRQCNVVIQEGLTSLQAHKITHLLYPRYVKCKLCERRYAGLGNHGNHFRKVHIEFVEPNNKEREMPKSKVVLQ